MKVSPGVRILVGLLTAFVTVYPLCFMAFFMLMFGSIFLTAAAAPSTNEPPPFLMAPFGLFFVMFPVQFIVVFLMIGLQVFYLIHLLKNEVAAELARVLLGIGFFFVPFVAMPLYYYLYLWRPHPPNWAVAPGYESDTSIP